MEKLNSQQSESKDIISELEKEKYILEATVEALKKAQQDSSLSEEEQTAKIMNLEQRIFELEGELGQKVAQLQELGELIEMKNKEISEKSE